MKITALCMTLLAASTFSEAHELEVTLLDGYKTIDVDMRDTGNGYLARTVDVFYSRQTKGLWDYYLNAPFLFGCKVNANYSRGRHYTCSVRETNAIRPKGSIFSFGERENGFYVFADYFVNKP